MIVHNMRQGSEEWINARLGIPTASQFSRILTPKTRKPSAGAAKYLCELVAERIIGSPLNSMSSEFMLRGGAMEEEAVAAYEFEHDCTTEPVGFITDDAHRWGCSPDRLVGADGMLEIKCVNAANHVAALLEMHDEDYITQRLGQLWIAGRAWVDLMYYNPMMPTHTVRIVRDEEHIAALAAAVEAFADNVDRAHASIVGPRGGAGAGTTPTDARTAAAL